MGYATDSYLTVCNFFNQERVQQILGAVDNLKRSEGDILMAEDETRCNEQRSILP